MFAIPKKVLDSNMKMLETPLEWRKNAREKEQKIIDLLRRKGECIRSELIAEPNTIRSGFL